jgi:hypothetical protein
MTAHSFTQLHLGDADNDLGLVLADLRPTPSELSAQRSISFEMVPDDLDYREMCLLATSSGRQFYLFRYPRAPRNQYTAVAVSRGTEDVTSALNEILEALELGSGDVISFHSGFRFETYSLWRQDDYGNLSKVREFHCRADATRELRRISSSVHKQTYWIEPGVTSTRQ